MIDGTNSNGGSIVPIPPPKPFKEAIRVVKDNRDALPAAIAARFQEKDERKRPFTYFKGGVPSELSEQRAPSDIPRASPNLSIPRVLPIASTEQEEDLPTNPKEYEQNMPVTHLQYNSPFSIYSEESRKEALFQQTGIAAPIAPTPKGWNPAKSETLKLLMEEGHEPHLLSPHSARYEIPSRAQFYPDYRGFIDSYQQSPTFKKLQFVTNQQEPADIPVQKPTFGESREMPIEPTFGDRIAMAERPKVPPKKEPDWIEGASRKHDHWEKVQTRIQPERVPQPIAPVGTRARSVQPPTARRSDVGYRPGAMMRPYMAPNLDSINWREQNSRPQERDVSNMRIADSEDKHSKVRGFGGLFYGSDKRRRVPQSSQGPPPPTAPKTRTLLDLVKGEPGYEYHPSTPTWQQESQRKHLAWESANQTPKPYTANAKFSQMPNRYYEDYGLTLDRTAQKTQTQERREPASMDMDRLTRSMHEAVTGKILSEEEVESILDQPSQTGGLLSRHVTTKYVKRSRYYDDYDTATNTQEAHHGGKIVGPGISEF